MTGGEPSLRDRVVLISGGTQGPGSVIDWGQNVLGGMD
jgi:hypothetical protein